MSSDVNANMLPVPSANKSQPPVRKSAPTSRTDGRKFSQELAGAGSDAVDARGNAAQNAQGQARKLQNGSEDLQEKIAKAVRDKMAEKTPGQTPQTPIDPATLDTRALRVAMRDVAASARDADPVLFLTGKLDKLDPTQIPSLVSDNSFISDAIAGGDIAGFMRSPIAIESLFEDLDVSDEIVYAMEAAGVNLTGTIAPRDLFKAMGVDAARVESELMILSDALPVDGVQPYVERAQRMQGRIASTPASYQSGAKQATDKAQNQQTAKTAAQRGASATVAASQFGGAPKVSASRNQAMGNPFAAMSAAQPLAGVSTPSPAAQTSPLNMGDLSVPSMSSEVPSQTVAASKSPVGVAIPEMNVSSSPQMKSTDVDPFTQMGRKLQGVETINIPTEPVKVPAGTVSTGSLEESLMQSQWQVGSEPTTQSFGPAVKVSEAMSGQLTQVARPVTPEAVNPDIELDPTWQAPKSAKTNTNLISANVSTKANLGAAVATQTQQATADMRMPIEDLQLDTSAWNRDAGELADDTSSGFSQGQSGQGGFDLGTQGRNLEGLASAARPEGLGRGEIDFGSQLAAESAEVSTADRAQAVQQIMDKALGMIRRGGGSVALDFSGLKMGQLEMAVSVAGDRVDLKILTDSDRVREALSGDISALRDALSSQNMSLGSVDVGVDSQEGKEQQSFAGSKQFQQDSEQNARELQEEFSELLGGLERDAKNVVPSLENLRQMPIVPPQVYDQGQIAVRV